MDSVQFHDDAGSRSINEGLGSADAKFLRHLPHDGPSFVGQEPIRLRLFATLSRIETGFVGLVHQTPGLRPARVVLRRGGHPS